MSDELDEFGEAHPAEQEHCRQEAVLSSPGECRSVEEVPQYSIADEGWRGQGRQVHCICAPWLLVPDLTLDKQAREVASPVTSSPSQTLLQELGVVFESGLNLTVWMVLHVYLPIVIDQPSCDEIVVVGVELVLAKPPLLIGEAACESWIFDDLGAIGASTTR